ncbi:MAG TPA: hypothetical protein VF572_01325 [Candidatus Saccharimonadales bacterium]|jgi:hypothetical protein
MNKSKKVQSQNPLKRCKPLGPRIGTYQERLSTDEGKFIRIGQLIVVAPFDCSDDELDISHQQLLRAAFAKPKLAPRARQHLLASDAAGIKKLVNEDHGYVESLHDAGQFIVSAALPELAAEYQVRVFGKSFMFGQADAGGRALTGTIFQENLGNNFMVRAIS